MILSQNLRKGTAFIYQNEPWVVLDYSHLKLARSSAVIRLKIKNLLNGVIKEISLKSSDKFEEADLENKNYQFLYKQGDALFFMHPESYEQISIPVNIIEPKEVFLKEGEAYQIQFFKGNPVSILLPKNMAFKVTYTEPGFKGDTSSSTLKPATLENNLEVKVPLFINIGDTVLISTESLEYKERVKKA